MSAQTAPKSLHPKNDLVGPKGDDWSAHASEYAKLMQNGPMVSPIKAMLASVDSISPFSTATAILDIGCGPGTVTDTLLATHGSSIPSSTRLIASDFSTGMIAQVQLLREKHLAAAAANESPAVAAAAWARLETPIWDALDLAGLPDASLSHVLGSLVYFLLADPQRGLREARRVLAPRAVLAVSSWARVQWLDLLEEASRLACPAKTAGREAMALPKGWTSVGGVEAQLTEAGFGDVKAELVETFMPADEPESLVRWFVGFKNPVMQAFVEGFDEEDIERLVKVYADLVRERCEEPRRLVGIAVVATGRK
ncbi:hypothetical protein MBLNU459_g5573t1 [Dothideomycetes sp. NU459]